MAKLWMQGDHLVMIDGVLCYQDTCPCDDPCGCCTDTSPMIITVRWSCFSEDVNLIRDGCYWEYMDLAVPENIYLQLICSEDPMDPWWGLLGYANNGDCYSVFDERYDGTVDCAEDLLGKVLTANGGDCDCGANTLTITGVGA